MEAVRADLGFGLLEDDFPAMFLPAARVGDLRTHHPYGEKCYAFTWRWVLGEKYVDRKCSMYQPCRWSAGSGRYENLR